LCPLCIYIGRIGGSGHRDSAHQRFAGKP